MPATQRLRPTPRSRRFVDKTGVWLLGLAMASSGGLAGCSGTSVASARRAPSVPAPAAQAFEETIPGTVETIEMVPVPRPPEDPASGPLWMARTEVTWDLFDVFVFGLDRAALGPDATVDALSRPSEPYIAVDRGFGHAGFPALSVSLRSARAFCAWLSARTGRTYRLPTAEEFRHACVTGAVAGADGAPVPLEERAWVKENSHRKTHRVARKQADAHGVHDLLGNVAEWCEDAVDGPALLGGGYLDPAAEVTCAARKEPTPAWNATDPNIPKSPWWLADGSFIGFRVVCDEGPPPIDARAGGESEPER